MTASLTILRTSPSRRHVGPYGRRGPSCTASQSELSRRDEAVAAAVRLDGVGIVQKCAGRAEQLRELGRHHVALPSRAEATTNKLLRTSPALFILARIAAWLF